MAEHQVVSFQRTVTTVTHATSCRTLTSELTRRRDFIQPSPDESSYETRSRRSHPPFCSTASHETKSERHNYDRIPGSWFFITAYGAGARALFSPSTERAMAMVALARAASP